MRKWVVYCLLMILFLGNANFSVKASDITVSAASAVLIEATTGEVLFAKEADTPRPMASTTKLMTALLAAENGDWTRTVNVTAEMVAVEGSALGLRAGDTLSLYDTVCGMLLCSGNDAANAVALTLANSLPEFAAMMNQKASQLSMTNTKFVTPSGLDAEGHMSTALDMARLGAAVLRDPTLAEICKQKTAPVTINGSRKTVTNHNRLLSLYSDAVGLKTGFTKKAGRCLVSAATRDGLTLVAVTLNASDDWNDHVAMLDYGFSLRRVLSFPLVSLPDMPIVGGVKSEVALHYDQPADLVVSTQDEGAITATLFLPRFLFAPVVEGTEVGKVVYQKAGEIVATSPVKVVQAVPPRPTKSVSARYWQNVWALWTGMFV